LKISKLLLVAALAAVVASGARADGIDPKVIVKAGSGSTPITLTNPNPTVDAAAVANTGQCFDPNPKTTPACIDDVFQNQTGKFITSLTLFIPTITNLIFSCDAASLTFDFNGCNSTNVTGGTNINFTSSGSFHGVAPAVFKCVPDLDDLFGLFGSCDRDDWKFVGGEFAVDIEGAGVVPGTKIPVTVNTPEPGAGLLVFLGAIAFGLIGLMRKNALA
jgi:hypothetical protein